MNTPFSPLVHRFAVITACVALALPVMMGALVTTKDAGMAFRDWPSSDGHNLLLYPWLRSTGEKFLEHGHRLAGIVIGLMSIGLAIITARYETRPWVRWSGSVVLLAVIGQGLLGGQRVLLDARGLAFLHGVFASWVFALMSLVALVTGKNWREADTQPPQDWNWASLAAPISLVLVTQLQYVMGCLVRHHGMVVHEHLGGGILVFAMTAWVFVTAFASGLPWLCRSAIHLAVVVFLQVLLGLATFVAKYGFENYVAVQGSTFQVLTRTSHVCLGMLVWMLAVTHLVRVLRIRSRHQPEPSLTMSVPKQSMLAAGGSA